MAKIFAIDPGTTQSAYVIYSNSRLIEFGILDNEMMRDKAKSTHGNILAIEMVASYGMAVGKEVFETCFWSGRFVEAWGGEFVKVYRKEVKMHLCHSMRAKDANIRQAIMDRYGSTREAAIGTKKNPGPLYGVSKDVWAALGVAITAGAKI
jgi:hypothetical protein